MRSLVFCHIRGYAAHVSFGALMYSYVIQACYRLIGTIYYHQISLKIYTYAIGLQWIFAVVQLLPILLGKNQVYIEHEYLCQIAIENSKGICYINLTNYVIPVMMIVLIYYKITKSVREKVNNGTYRYNIHRARRQMVLTQRILILITIIFVLGGPYTVFIILEAFSIRRAPSYSHRIGFMFIAIACCLSIVTILYYAQTAREAIFKKNPSRKPGPPPLIPIALATITAPPDSIQEHSYLLDKKISFEHRES
ncbi:unnamed protein product [Adineta ricciae]|uniref:G-protein coupled receptors family 1 profile domain-containing protein n=1 Tax=Adineta ricciae TaxID=249248 RepID=A0A814X9W2_ADIRI|nr:unnamed protein product [Adineta ricciae]CAF1269758.1 unnamed protein product [Adineta ricciae]